MRRIFRRRAGLSWLLLLWAGCVPLPEEQVDRPVGLPPVPQGAFQGLGAGAQSLRSLHFEVHAYDSERARELSVLAESIYNRIVADEGVYSFRPERLYPIVLYATKEEFFSKTHVPADVGSGAVDGSGFLYFYEGGSSLAGVLAHELSHQMFRETMRSAEPVWLNEGLAVYEEQESSREPATSYAGRPIVIDDLVRPNAILQARLSGEMGFRTAGLDRRDGALNDWSWQAGTIVRFMIEKGGRTGFASFLRAVESGRGVDEALASSFHRWRDLKALEADRRAGG